MGKPVSDTEPTDLGRRLRALREAGGISMRELSKVAGASPAVVYQIERGLIAKPSAEIAILLARSLGTTPDYLILGEGDAPSADRIEAAFKAVVAASGVLPATGTDGEG